MRLLRTVTAMRFSGNSVAPTRSPRGTPRRAAKRVAPAETAREVRTASTRSGANDAISRKAEAKEATRKSMQRSPVLLSAVDAENHAGRLDEGADVVAHRQAKAFFRAFPGDDGRQDAPSRQGHGDLGVHGPVHD